MEPVGAIAEPTPREAQAALPPDFFYGMQELPFNRHLGMRFTRDADGAAVVSLAATGDGRVQADGAVYSLGEVAAAIALLDDMGAQPLLMVTDVVSFTSVASTAGEVFTRARALPLDPPPEPGAKRPRKLRLTAEVLVHDAEHRPLAELQVTFNARTISPALQEGLKA